MVLKSRCDFAEVCSFFFNYYTIRFVNEDFTKFDLTNGFQ